MSCSESCEQQRPGWKFGLNISLLPGVSSGWASAGGEYQLGDAQVGPSWSSPAGVMLGGAMSHRMDVATPAPRQDLSPAALESKKPALGLGGGRRRTAGGAASGAAVSGEGRRACGLKWPRSAAGVGSAMRQGLTPPPKGMLGKGKAKLHRENLCGGGG